ncbi:MAG TPA: hypothetical protein DHN33_11900 [Eubacteriaceae bacterium]|nr:hypothetical protein [Eubacteriaceae bacterium]
MKRKSMLAIMMVLLLSVLLVFAGCSGGGDEGENGDGDAVEENGNGDSGEEVELEDSISIGTHAVGTSYYAMGTGVASIVSDQTPISASVMPYSGPDAWLPDFQDGRISLGLLSGIDLAWAYAGEVTYDNAYDKARLILQGNLSEHATITVREDAGIDSIADLEGRPIGEGYGGNQLTQELQNAALAGSGLTMDDVEGVPVADLGGALRALQENRIDATFSGSSTTPSAVELDQSIGIKVLPFADLKPEDIADGVPQEYQDILNEHVPGAVLATASAKGTLKEDTVLINFPIMMIGSSDLSADAVYEILKSVWENHEQLADVHTWGSQWIPDTMPTENMPAPYHEGAVRFYEEQGVWTDAMQERQDELLN